MRCLAMVGCFRWLNRSVRLTVFATAYLASLTASLSASAADQPNVVLIVADDLGFQLGCYGDAVARTPNIDRLAASGTRFTHARCTTASCSASRSVLMSGLYNHATGHYGHAHGENHFSTYESVRSLPVVLSEAGYRTCSIGKYHLAPEYVYHFDAYRNDGIQGSRNSVRMAANAKAWIAEEDDRPFFLYFCSTDPHRGAGPGHFANFDDADHYPGVTPVRFDPADVPVPAWLPDNADVRGELSEYYQAINRLDQGVGQLLDAIEETGHADDTLVIFLSDNGPPFPGAKTNLYEPGAKLPLIVRNPRAENHAATCDAQVAWVDIFPTILDYCGVAMKPAPPVRPLENTGAVRTDGQAQPYALHGRSFLPAMTDEHPAGWDESFASHTFHEVTNYYPMRMISRGKHKLIFNMAHQLPYPFASDLFKSPTWQGVLRRKDELYGKRSVYDYVQRPRFELYDLEADPDETRNLAHDAQHQALVKELQDALRAWQERTNDPWVSKWRYE